MIDDIRIEPMNETHLKDLALLEKQCFSVPWSENALRAELEKEKYNYHWIYKGDVFLCDKDRYEYLSGNNKKKLVVVELDGILVEEEKQDAEKEEVASKKKTTRKRASKKVSKK